MKKVLFTLAIVASAALVSCGNKAAENADSAMDSVEVTDTTVVAEVAADSDTAIVAAETVTETPVKADSAK